MPLKKETQPNCFHYISSRVERKKNTVKIFGFAIDHEGDIFIIIIIRLKATQENQAKRLKIQGRIKTIQSIALKNLVRILMRVLKYYKYFSSGYLLLNG